MGGILLSLEITSPTMDFCGNGSYFNACKTFSTAASQTLGTLGISAKYR